jgi:DNA-binding NtrC family response regulator
MGKPGVRLSPDTLDLFDAFGWPGNVRQLRNEVQRAVAMASTEGVVTPELLSPVFGVTLSELDSPLKSRTARTTLSAAVEKLEREMIENALERAEGNISETARILGLTRRGLYLKMERLGVSASFL